MTFRSIRRGDFDWLAIELGDGRLVFLHRMARVGDCARHTGERRHTG